MESGTFQSTAAADRNLASEHWQSPRTSRTATANARECSTESSRAAAAASTASRLPAASCSALASAFIATPPTHYRTDEHAQAEMRLRWLPPASVSATPDARPAPPPLPTFGGHPPAERALFPEPTAPPRRPSTTSSADEARTQQPTRQRRHATTHEAESHRARPAPEQQPEHQQPEPPQRPSPAPLPQLPPATQATPLDRQSQRASRGTLRHSRRRGPFQVFAREQRLGRAAVPAHDCTTPHNSTDRQVPQRDLRKHKHALTFRQRPTPEQAPGSSAAAGVAPVSVAFSNPIERHEGRIEAASFRVTLRPRPTES